MKSIFTGLSAVVILAALTAGCGYSEHTYAVQAPAYAPAVTYYPTTTYVYPGY